MPSTRGRARPENPIMVTPLLRPSTKRYFIPLLNYFIYFRDATERKVSIREQGTRLQLLLRPWSDVMGIVPPYV